MLTESNDPSASAVSGTGAVDSARGSGTARSTAATEALVLENLNVHYGKVQALRGVNMRIEPGEFVALLGSNGAGKTTTLRAISGLVAPSAGSIRFGEHEVGGLPAHEVVGHGIAHLPEGRELFPTLTVEENLRFGYYPQRKDGRYEERLQEVYGIFPRLRERRKQAAGTMSGGEQQMLGAARALMSRPQLLMIDELSLGLAPMIVADLFAVLRDVNDGGTSVLIVEQFVHLALENSHRAYVLAKGEIVLEGSSAEMAGDQSLIDAYLGG